MKRLITKLRIVWILAIGVALCLPTALVTAGSAQAATPKAVNLTAAQPAAAGLAMHPGHGDVGPFKALVFSKTAGFRHGSIPVGIAAIQKLGAENGFTVDATEDAGKFTDANLAQYDVVIWLSTTGDVLDNAQQAAFERYIKAGGGYAGIHAASDTEYEWPWYGKLVGSYFSGHPANQNAKIKVEDPAHPSTAGMDPVWNRYDEWYNFNPNPRNAVHTLASLDESSYSGGTNGVEHPISWCQDFDGGRSWYTGMGHTDESFAEPQFLHHLLGGIQTAAGVVPADCTATLESSFEKITLDDNTSNPMDLTIADDGRVYYIDRSGDVKTISTSGTVSTMGRLSVTTVQEFGLLGIAIDPDFATNRYMYLYWSPSNQPTKDRVSRFTVTAANTLDMASEKTVLEINVQRSECCHAGGALEFDNDGNLYIATGDNTNPFASDGYSPMDERPGRSAWDAQGTSGNTNNLNGKILRITPKADGTYSIPAGNLFPEGTAKTRPEIYAMGFRNPFRIGIDEQTNKLLVADYGPDAGSANPNRGPGGRVEWNILTKPGNYGWPYCVSNNAAYNDYNFATSQSGPKYDCAAIVNDSPNNTGLTNLPPAIPATMWQGNDATGNPEIGQSGAPMTSGTYKYDEALESDRKWPAYFDGKAIWADWNNSRLFTILMNKAHTDVVDVSRFLAKMPMTRPHALQFGPDGALYMIEWGSGFGGNNADSGIYRIDYVQGNRAPIARASADKTSGPAPLTVKFDSEGSRDPDGTPITFAWDFNGDGTVDSTEAAPTYTFTNPGEFNVTLTVKDEAGRTGTSNLKIVSGNTAPKITVEAPVNGGFFEFGDSVKYKVSGSDAEDGAIDCAKVIVQPALGHDEHAHPYDQYKGCEGTIAIPGDEGHVGANIFGTISVKYTDAGAAGTVPLTTEEIVILHPKRREAEYFQRTGRLAGSTSTGDAGVIIENTGDAAGGSKNVGYIEPGDYFGWDVMNLTNIEEISMRAASPNAGGAKWEVRTGDPNTGETVATINVANTGDWQVYQNFKAQVTGSTTKVSGPLYFVEISGGSNINWVDFIGRGVTDNQRPNLDIQATPVSGNSPLKVDFTATASDPENDTPLTIDWVFGDGNTATGATVSHTYRNPGTYTATATVTDARGAKNHKNVQIKVIGAGLGNCFSGRSDDFLGDSLDLNRWDSSARVNQELTVSDGQLHIPLTATDIHGGGTATKTPNIVLQKLPGGAFEVTSKVTLEAVRQYQQAGLILYNDDDNYLKMVIQGRTTSPDKAGRVFQFLSEVGGSPTETNTAALGANFPDTFWVRLSSTNGVDVTASYSADGVDFTAMSGTRSMAHLQSPKVGLFGLVNNANALPITAHFDNFLLIPDDKAKADSPDDEFAGTSLDMCRWNAVVRGESGSVAVKDGKLHITTSKGDIYGADNSAPKNFILQRAPEGDWTIETKVDASAFNEQYQQAGLMAYVDDANYVKFDYLATNTAGQAVTRGIELRSEIGDVVQNPQPNASPAPTQGVWYLKLTKKGDTFTGEYSADGHVWTQMGPLTNAALNSSALRIGVFAFGVNQQAEKTATFDYFHLTKPAAPDTTAPKVAATVLGSFAGDVKRVSDREIGGTATMEVQANKTTATLSLTGLRTDGVYQSHLHVGTCDSPGLHYKNNPDGVGQPPNELWPHSAGVKPEGTGATITVNPDGTASASHTVDWAPRIDGRALMIHDQGAMVACATLSLTGAGTVVLDASDEESGIAKTEYRIDGGPWTTYTAAFVIDQPGDHKVDWRTEDKAGNTADGSFNVTVPQPPDTTAPVVEVTVNPAAPDGANGWYRSEVSVTAKATDDKDAAPKVEVKVGNGQWAAYDGRITLTRDGVHTLTFRATDAAGNVSDVVTKEIRIDATAPAVSITGLADGADISVAAVRTVTVSATDATSGVDKVTIKLDGNVVSSPVAIDASKLAAGSHTLQVVATDKAGNSTTRVVTFQVVVSFAGTFDLIDRLEAAGQLTSKEAKKLRSDLIAAQRHFVAGRLPQTKQALNSFIASAQTVADRAARAALVSAGEELLRNPRNGMSG